MDVRISDVIIGLVWVTWTESEGCPVSGGGFFVCVGWPFAVFATIADRVGMLENIPKWVLKRNKPGLFRGYRTKNKSTHKKGVMPEMP